MNGVGLMSKGSKITYLQLLQIILIFTLSFGKPAEGQSLSTDRQAQDVGLRPFKVQWQSLPSPAARVAASISARRLNLPLDQVPALDAAMYVLSDGRTLLLIRGGEFRGASSIGLGIYLGDLQRIYTEVGSVIGNKSDEMPVIVVPQRKRYPSLNVSVTQALPFNPRLSMAEQQYRVVDHLLRFNEATGRYYEYSFIPK